MNKLTKFLERLAPPGSNYMQQIFFLIGTPLLSIWYSFGYFVQYSQAYYSIFDRRTGARISPDPMPFFWELLCLDAFPIFCVSWIAFVIASYLYFFQESKSIYTMRRLRSPFELHLRCWALPVLGVLILGLCYHLCYWLYSLHYFNATPASLIPPQAVPFWR